MTITLLAPRGGAHLILSFKRVMTHVLLRVLRMRGPNGEILLLVTAKTVMSNVQHVLEPQPPTVPYAKQE